MTNLPAAHAQHVVINEVMYAPIKPEPEWIELFNPTDSAVSTIGWTVSNHLRNYAVAPDTIAPHGYLIITKDSAQYLRTKYLIPTANILQTTVPSLGNSGDVIVFKDSSKNIIDSLKYSPTWGGSSGASLERIDYGGSTDSSNFGECINANGATPGAQNSIRRRDFDLALDSIWITSSNQNELIITARIVNKGRKQIGDGIVSIYSNSGLPIGQSLITTLIPPLQRREVVLPWPNPDFGRTNLTAIINESQDEVHSNDTIKTEAYIPILRNAVVINEIMATPKPTSSEWIELYNTSSTTVRADSLWFTVGFVDTTYRYRIDSLTLPPKNYAVIDASVTFFSTFPLLKGKPGMIVLNKSKFNLADSGARIMLTNTDGSIIDSLSYLSSWHSQNITNHAGISLEKRYASGPSTDPLNWASSFDPQGCTPLQKNSNSSDTLPTPSAIDIQISPNPFSPDGDGFNDATNITIVIPSENEQVISAKLYDLRGRLRSTIAQNQRVYRTESFHFEGKDDNGITLPIGLYTLVVESSSGLFKPQRTGVVIMKKAR